ncbi:MAG: DUF4331 domain-containing protein, partial [Pseudomonadota bacterium]|nr:DUF4331 domain-containing protein [Pseudomonadota bacterium]
MASALAVILGIAAPAAVASSHREAPFITLMPKVDSTDMYAFRSYEPGRSGYVTLIANYQPFQLPEGGPNYYTMDPDALYDIHIDNVGDAQQHLTFQFTFHNFLYNNVGKTLTIGGVTQPIALRADGPITTPDNGSQGEFETFQVVLVTGSGATSTRATVTDASTGAGVFRKPIDNIGFKTLPNYPTYADQTVYNINVPGCSGQGRMFVGQREEAFAINLGESFDLVNYVPIEGDSAPFKGDG